MPAKQPRRSMADLLEQREIEDPLGDDPRPGLAAVPELPRELEPTPTPPPSATHSAFLAVAVPAPHSPTGHGQLSNAEEADLAVCEAALDNLRMAFAAAGKALAVIQAGRLYRGTYDTFDDYVGQRWGMGKSQAYRLIEAWPLAERLSPIGERLTESHVRELLPLAKDHGEEAAATVYKAVQDAGGVRVTATVLREVVTMLPGDYWDPDEAVRQIRVYLAGDRTPPAPPAAGPVAAFVRAARTISKLEQDAADDVLEAARAVDPELVRRLAARMRALADRLDRGPSA